LELVDDRSCFLDLSDGDPDVNRFACEVRHPRRSLPARLHGGYSLDLKGVHDHRGFQWIGSAIEQGCLALRVHGATARP